MDIKADRISLTRSLSEHSTTSQRSREASVNIDPSGEVSDSEELEEKEALIEGEGHSVLMNLMSQLKLGADLTNVVLPSFILEPRSLLEMFADCMRHPDFLVRMVMSFVDKWIIHVQDISNHLSTILNFVCLLLKYHCMDVLPAESGVLNCDRINASHLFGVAESETA
ncbi:oxysterol-binding protein-related protein 10-like [Stegodyphus dumicola]|uniref:oxysterol-binding protein-related protein 10-like n=1 Tax=Stegodyphus dumicola TaxID=202533 RepID=UPI0015B30C7F|nr:oxysterol-binding protein-related protein 10-like [Stegodyphus dumicola]